MVNVKVRRSWLGTLAVLMTIVCFISLNFAVIQMDFFRAFDTYNGALDGAILGSYQETGFDFFDGQCNIIILFERIMGQRILEYSIYPSFREVEMFVQVFNYIILACSAIMFLCCIVWLCFLKKDGMSKAIAILAIWVGVLYCIEGILLTVSLNTEWEKLMSVFAEHSTLEYSPLFYTSAYIPLSIIAILEVVFWIVYFKTRAKPQTQTVWEQPTEYVPTEGAPAETMEVATYEVDLFGYLERLKELYDAGVLTEEEFLAEKARILNQ